MAITYKKFFGPTVLTVSPATLMTVDAIPATTTLRTGRIKITNTGTTAASATLYAVPAGGSAAAGNAFANLETIPANQSRDFDVPVMAAGDIIQGKSDTASVLNAQLMAGALFS